MKRIISLFLTMAMILCLAPYDMEAHAVSTEDRGFITLKKDDSTIAPGITQTIATVRKKYNGQQLVYYTMTVDTKVETAHIYANYKDNEWEPHANGQYGMQTVTAQMDAAVKNHTDPNSDRYIENYTVVGGINGTGYNMSTGQTRGILVMEGHILQEDCINSSGKPEPFFAIMKDGTPKIFWNTDGKDWTNNKDNIQEAIDSFVYPLVKNGEIVCGTQNSPNARTAIGITADKKVVMLVTDGKLTTSEGCDMYELALILKEAGCVDAFNLDGGGSTTFVSRPEGESTYRVVSNPCDGSPRSVSASLLVVSTEAPSDVFKRAVLTPEHDYVTPGSTVKVDAVGVSPAGDVVDIPEGYSWQLADSSLGSVKNGVFTSNGKAGDAVVQINVDGQVVGDTTIHVVVPDSLSFRQEGMTAPYGKTIPLNITAYYGLIEVTMKDGDLLYTLSDNNAGTVTGFSFSAPESGPASVTLTATCRYDESVNATATISMGRASEVLFDFEDGKGDMFDLSYSGFNYYLPNSDVYVVNESNGKVHSGSRALALNIDYSNSLESGYQLLGLAHKGDAICREGVTSIGMWIYVPVDNVSLWARWVNMAYDVQEDGTHKVSGTGQLIDGEVDGVTGWVNTLEESGWHYISQDVSANDGAEVRESAYIMQFYISDRDGAQFDFPGLKDPKSGDYCNLNGNYTFYIDDITVDYSSAVDDRDPPVFSELTYAAAGMSEAAAIARKTIPTATGSSLTFAAKVADKNKPNATGLDASTARAYVDGNEIPCTYSSGMISMNATQELSNGVHTIKFTICDYQGNYGSIIRQVNVQAPNGDSGVLVVAHDPSANRVPLGSVQYIDIVAPADKEVASLTARLNLDSMNSWELDHMEVATGYTAKWSMPAVDTADNIATVTIERDEAEDIDWTAGENVLASLPVRVWNLDNPVTVGSTTYTVNKFIEKAETWPIAIDLKVDRGSVTYLDDTAEGDSFSGGGVRIWSELWGTNAFINLTAEGQAYWKNLAANGAHSHTLGSPENKDPDCLHTGYKDRVSCTVCKSPVNWGTTVPAGGHNWAVVEDEESENNGKLACTGCKKLLTGEYEGKTYKDGVMLDGWVDESYYSGGVKLTGFQQIKKPDAEEETLLWYLFDDDGVCEGKKPYTGEYEEKGYQDGVLHTGWLSNDSYYIDGVKQTEEFYEIGGKLYRFENGVCKGQNPYTGFRTIRETVDEEEVENRYYYELGVLETGDEDGWFQFGDETCHACKGKGGALGTVTVGDNRTCTQDGYKFFLCSCKEQKMSEALWAEGHKWKSDTERVCTVCGHEALDISTVRVEFTGSPYHVYTGSAIRAAHTVYDGDRQLIVESDRRGTDGLASYENNINVGKATLRIEGRGDYDEKTFVTANFYIIPADVPALRAQTGGADSVLLDWDAAPGATYYAVYQRQEGDEDWTQIAAVRTLSFTATGLEQGNTYQFRIGSRAEVEGEKDPYVSANWTETEITLEHEWGEPFDVVEGDCTTDGSYKHTCEVCGKTEEVIVPAPGHDVEEWETTAEPTIREPGVKTGVCVVCGETVTQEIEKLPSYAINISQAANGSVTAEPDDIAGAGESVTVSTEPNSGYKLDKLSVTYTDEDGTHELEVTDGVFTMPSADVTVSASFVRISTGGGGGGGGMSSGSTPPSTTTNGDGSTTKTETKSDGTTVETTTKTDGTKIETETKPDGSKSVEVKQADGTTASATVTSDGKTEAEVKLSDTAVQQAAGSSIVLPIPEVKVDRGSGGASATVKVSVPQTVQSDKPVRVTVPVAEIKSGDVAVIVNSDGSETVVKKSTVTENGLSIPLEEGATIKIVDNSKEFKDTGSHWSHDAVSFVTSRELFNGVSEDSFAPNAAMDRAMLVTVLHRLEDLPAGGQVQFPDVKGDTWYSEAVAWASEKNIVIGYENGSFGPNDRITREQIVVILYRYAATQNIDTGKLGSLAAFADGASTAPWAQESMSWAVGAGLFQGSDGRLEPQKSATRAEVAVILQRFVEYMAS